MYRLGLFTIILIVFPVVQAGDLSSIDYRPKPFTGQDNDSISIQTLNVYHTGYAAQNIRRGSSIVKMLEQDSSDINFFQEVWLEYFYTNMQRVSQSIGLKSIIYDNVAKNARWSGLVTIVRGNIHRREMHFFPPGKRLV